MIKITDTNLTASPKEHLKRAKNLLNSKYNSVLLYAALELRFALERMVQNQLIFIKDVSNKILKEYDPIKKQRFMEEYDENFKYAHDIYATNKTTGEKFLYCEYRPLDIKKAERIKGKLGDLLHAQDGLTLGISDCNWYIDTRNFLEETHIYLFSMLQSNENYFIYKQSNNFEMVKKG